MTPRRASTAAALTVAAIALAASSAAAGVVTSTPIAQSKLLWATVNVCDTAGHPDTIGLRASMPGDGIAAEELYMRFQVQVLNRKDGTWQTLPRGGDSGFLDLGSSRARVRETGRLFTFAPPTSGAFQLRGLVTFDWRADDGTIVRRLRRLTTMGHRSAAGADPQGYSADTCAMT